MLLIKKQKTINLKNNERVRQIICISSKMLLICKSKSLTLYDLQHDFNIEETFPNQWTNNGKKIIKESITLMETVFHPHLKEKEKHQNWILAQLSLENNHFASPNILADFQQNPSKYERMELKPRLILLPTSNYMILLRQFYNDSMVTIYEHSKLTQYFYVNQQNMSQFNEKNVIVSFRSLFSNKIMFELFDVSKDCKNNKKNVEIYHGNKNGVILAIKSVYYQGKTWSSSNMYGKEQKNNDIEHFRAVLVINWNNKSISYLIYQSQTKAIIQSLTPANSNPDTMFLSFFTINSFNRVCSMQRKGNSTFLMLQNIIIDDSHVQQINKFHNKKQNQQLYPIDPQLQQWQVYKIGLLDFVVVTYSQPALNENEVKCQLFRSVRREEAFMSLVNEMGFSENIMKFVMELIGNQC